MTKRESEKIISWALYNNPKILFQEIKKNLGNVQEIKKIAREIPLIQEIKSSKKHSLVSGYTTGWQYIWSDLIIYALTKDGTSHLFFYEIKVGNLGKGKLQSAINQSYKYPPAFVSTFYSKLHHQRGEIFKKFLDEIFQYRNVKIQNQLKLHPILLIISDQNLRRY